MPPSAEDAAAGAKPTRAPVARRDFLRGGLLAALGVFLAEFGGASLAFLWPNLKGQFGSVIVAGSLTDIKAYIEQNNQPFYLGAGRFYIVPYHGDGANTIYAGLVDQNLMALYQRCVHLGAACRSARRASGSSARVTDRSTTRRASTSWSRPDRPAALPAEGGRDRGHGRHVEEGRRSASRTDTIHEPPQGPFCVGGAGG